MFVQRLLLLCIHISTVLIRLCQRKSHRYIFLVALTGKWQIYTCRFSAHLTKNFHICTFSSIGRQLLRCAKKQKKNWINHSFVHHLKNLYSLLLRHHFSFLKMLNGKRVRQNQLCVRKSVFFLLLLKGQKMLFSFIWFEIFHLNLSIKGLKFTYELFLSDLYTF